ncbi:MAG: PAS domain S-box protein [Mariprofundales bacterium]|nr:PAS domain S-box protein [Mariprofundales bacterium]
MDAAHAEYITVPSRWQRIYANWSAIKSGEESRGSLWQLHSENIKILIRHLYSVGEQTGIIRDQDTWLHRLVMSQLMIMPHLLEDAGQLRGLGVSYVTGHRLAAVDAVQLGALVEQVKQGAAELAMVLQPLLARQDMAAIARLYRQFGAQMDAFVAVAHQQFALDGDGVSEDSRKISPRGYFDLATQAIHQGVALNGAVLGYIDQRLQQKIDEQLAIKYNITLAAMGFLGVILLLFISFYLSVMLTIRALQSSAERMRSGVDESALVRLPARDELGGVVAAFNTIAQELVRAHKKSAAIIDHALSGVITIDGAGVVQSFNPAAEAMFAYSADEVVGRNITMLMPERWRAEHRQGLMQMAATQHSASIGKTLQVEGLRSGGEQFPLELLITRMEHHGEQLFIGMLRDTSEHDRLERQLRQAQKMEAVGTLVGGVAHNFNNMLAAIVGRLYLAKRKVRDDAKLLKDISLVEEVVCQVRDMINQLLLFAQRDFMRQQRACSLAVIVREEIDQLRGEIDDGIELLLHIAGEEMMIHCDASQIRQVLRALVLNSCSAVAAAPVRRIEVSLARFAPDQAFMRRHAELQTAGDYACMQVRDSGCGMDEETLTKIFEPFYTTKEVGDGVGLGLSSAFGTIASHQGVIEVESRVANGSLFKVYLPLLSG